MSRSDFERSVKELNPYVPPVGLHAIEYEYTSWLNPNDTASMIDALDKRSAGIKVPDVATLVDKLKNVAKVI